MKPLKLLCAVAVFAGATSWASPAQAAPRITFSQDCGDPGPSPTPTPAPSPAPLPECTPGSGQIVRGDRVIVFTVDAGSIDRIRRVEVRLESTEEGVPSVEQPVASWDFPDLGEAPRSQTFRYTWAIDDATPYNGIYRLAVRARSHGDSTVSEQVRDDLKVDEPPDRLPAPEVVVATGKGVSVSWEASTVPDLLSYTLLRARTGSASTQPDHDDFRSVRVTTATSALDEVQDPGAYWYRVVATRRSVVTPDEGIPSSPSATSQEAGVVVGPTPTPAGDGGEGGGIVRSSPRPRLTPRPLKPRSTRAPAVPDAPFSAFLPYELEDGEVEASDDGELGSGDLDAEPGDETPAALPGVAIGAFLVSAALALGRMPT